MIVRKMVNVPIEDEKLAAFESKVGGYKRKVDNPPLTQGDLVGRMFEMFVEDPEKVLKFLKFKK